jgi:hypothetical protein
MAQSSSWKKRVEKGIPHRHHRHHRQQENDEHDDNYQRRRRNKNMGRGVRWFLAFSGVGKRRCGSQSGHSADHSSDTAADDEVDEDEDNIIKCMVLTAII